MNGCWVEPDKRDEVVDFVKGIRDRTAIAQMKLLSWIELSRNKYYDWIKRYGQVNAHNGLVPRDFWLEVWEKKAIIENYKLNPCEGYRRLTYMLMDADIVVVSPATTYRVLHNAGLLMRRKSKPSKKGTGFVQPLKPHEHWHTDISYINIAGTFYYFCSVLDGCSRAIVHWEIKEKMKEADVELIIQRALEKTPGVKPRIISDNGPQYIARDFKEYIRLQGLTHVRTSPYYPQSNGKLERMHKTLKKECIRPRSPQSLKEAKTIISKYVEYYNTRRLHSAIGYISPQDMLQGRQKEIQQQRDHKLEQARKTRKDNYRKERENKARTNSFCGGRNEILSL